MLQNYIQLFLYKVPLQTKLFRTSMKYFNIGTKIFLLTIRRQLSEFLTVFNTDFAYLYFYRNCAKRRGHTFKNKFHQRSSFQSQCFISALLIHPSHTKDTDQGVQTHLQKCQTFHSLCCTAALISTFGPQRKLCRRAQRRRFIFQLYMFPEALTPTQEQLWVW